jgi:nucleoside-diphosphate-sugar epimerase
VLKTEGAWRPTWNFAGAGAVTQRDFAEQVFRMAGRKPRIRVAGKNMVWFLGLFKPLRELVEMNYLLTTPVLMDDSALRNLLGGIHKTPYEEGLRISLEAAQSAL